MKSRRFKSVLAVVLSIAMIMGTNVITTMAAPVAEGGNLVVSGDDIPLDGNPEGKVTASGQMEGWVEKNVFKITVPVSASANDTLKFVMDPQNLIASTGGIAKGWTDAQIVESTLYFTQSGNAAHSVDTSIGKYSNVSNPLSVNNLSSVSVDVSLKVKMNDIGNITLSSNDTYLTTDKTPKMYMGMTVRRGTKDSLGSALPGTPLAMTATQAVSTNMLASIPGGNEAPTNERYGLSYNGTEYTYELGKGYAIGSSPDTVLEFYFKGTTNPNADWKAINEAPTNPKLEVIWDVRTHTDELPDPSVTLTNAGVITIANLTADKNYTSGILSAAGVAQTYPITTNSTRNDDNYNAQTGGTIVFTLGSQWLSNWNGKLVTVTVTLSDGSTISGSCQW